MRTHQEKCTVPAVRFLRGIKRWRLQRSKHDGVPAYVVFNDATLEEIARRTPGSPAELVAVPGIGLTKLERYGDDILRTVAEAATVVSRP